MTNVKLFFNTKMLVVLNFVDPYWKEVWWKWFCRFCSTTLFYS